MSILGKPDAGFIFFLLYCSHVMVLDEGRYLGGTRRQLSAPRSLDAHQAPAALARELGEQG